jgi:hypothetical protein
MNNSKLKLSILILAVFTLGFRIFPGAAKWNISAVDPAIWIRICERPEFDKNDLPSGDALANQTLTFNLVLQSIKDDYNNVSTSFTELRDSAVDSGFDPSSSRIIDVCFSGLFMASGFASRKVANSQVVGCDIKLSDRLKTSPRAFISTLTHELGHCMGLDHTQDLSYSIMSYFRDRDLIRLQIDDKMGLTFLYPSDPEYGHEASTLGLSCN